MAEEMIVEYIFPCKIAIKGGSMQGEGELLNKKTLQIDLNEPILSVFDAGSFIVLDFGKEYAGGVRILSHVNELEGAKVHVRFGESLSESCSVIGEKNSTNHHSPRDFFAQLPNFSDNTYGQSGFRFVRLDFENRTALKSVVCAYTHRNHNVLGYFECSDERVNQIFNVAARTVLLCDQQNLWDGIKRDRLVWVGDMHPESRALSALLGSSMSVERAIDFAREQTPLPCFMNNIPGYSMWWIVVLHDYYMQTGNEDLLTRSVTYLNGLIDVMNQRVNDDGDCNYGDYFLDCQSIGSDGLRAAIRGLNMTAANCAAYLLNQAGQSLNQCSKLIDKLQRKHFSYNKLKQGAAFSALAGLCDIDAAVQTILDGGAKGLSTYICYYMFLALDKGGKTAEAVQIMKTYYGAMLDKGATTFWEDFIIDWADGSCRIDELPTEGQKDIHGDFGDYCYKGFRRSLCHGWSSAPVPFLLEAVLGVKILEPGCRSIAIIPNLAGLEWVKGAYPTPLGEVKVEVTRENGKINISVDAPAGIVIEH